MLLIHLMEHVVAISFYEEEEETSVVDPNTLIFGPDPNTVH